MNNITARTRILSRPCSLPLIPIAFSQRPTGDKVERYKHDVQAGGGEGPCGTV